MNTTPIEFMLIIQNKAIILRDSYEMEAYLDDIASGKAMQLTALHSINDESIYNHMIVKDSDGDYAVVDMFDYLSMFALSMRKLEIVGNRFQHPELLELCK